MDQNNFNNVQLAVYASGDNNVSINATNTSFTDVDTAYGADTGYPGITYPGTTPPAQNGSSSIQFDKKPINVPHVFGGNNGTAPQHLVTLHSDDQTNCPVSSVIVIVENGTMDDAGYPPPMWTGYTFGEWMDAPAPGGVPYVTSTAITADTDLYATCTANPAPVVPPPGNNNGTWSTSNNTVNGNSTYSGGVGATSSQVVLTSSSSSVTGGSGRVANGQDTQLLQVTLGGNQVGSTTGFSITSVPAGVTLASVTSTGTGSFQLALTSDTPGIYRVSVQYNGVTIGTVSNVNFIDGSVSAQAIAPGGTQILTGQGFLPGEMVTITVHSDPIQVGRLAADANGNVQVSFVIPKNFGLGSHEAIFTGDKSGSVSVPFQVTSTLVSTGGSVSSTGSAGLAGLLVMAGLAAGALIWRRRTTLIC